MLLASQEVSQTDTSLPTKARFLCSLIHISSILIQILLYKDGYKNWCIASYLGTFSLFALLIQISSLLIQILLYKHRYKKLIHCFVLRHVFSVRSADTDFLNTDTDTVVQTRIQKTDSLLRLKARFLCPLCWYTLSKSAPSTQYHSAPVYITKTHFYDRNTIAFLVCLLFAFGWITAILRFLSLSEQHSCFIR